METMRLGRTELTVGRTAFGALPIQRVDFEKARSLLRSAFDAGVTFFDTARGYSDSEEKVGYALADVRDRIVLATKVRGDTPAEVLEQTAISLEKLRTDYVDVLQLHNPSVLPDAADDNSSYAGLLEARRRGMARFIGITNHSLDRALAAAASGGYDTVQFPINAISSERDLHLIEVCKDNDVGVIAMKAFSGGLLRDARAAFAFLRQFDNVLPIWGIQRQRELDEFLALEAGPPALDDAMWKIIETDRRQLAGDFCRGCGYCLPCPADIPISMAARFSLLLRRAPTERFLTKEWQDKMRRIEDCTDCGQCAERCPYELDTPRLLKKMYEDYQTFLT
jgi:predicted aldo/keto reductase-like oxidoreductase